MLSHEHKLQSFTVNMDICNSMLINIPITYQFAPRIMYNTKSTPSTTRYRNSQNDLASFVDFGLDMTFRNGRFQMHLDLLCHQYHRRRRRILHQHYQQHHHHHHHRHHLPVPGESRQIRNQNHVIAIAPIQTIALMTKR